MIYLNSSKLNKQIKQVLSQTFLIEKEVNLLNSLAAKDSSSSSTESNYKTAFIRNLNEPYTIPAEQLIVLQNDGLRSGGLNTFDYEIWNATTQTLKPTKIGERYFVRVTLSIKSEFPAIIDLSVKVGNSTIASPIRFQPSVADEWENQSILFTFFIGGAFAPDEITITNGAQFFIYSSEIIDITNLSFDIFTSGGV